MTRSKMEGVEDEIEAEGGRRSVWRGAAVSEQL